MLHGLLLGSDHKDRNLATLWMQQCCQASISMSVLLLVGYEWAWFTVFESRVESGCEGEEKTVTTLVINAKRYFHLLSFLFHLLVLHNIPHLHTLHRLRERTFLCHATFQIVFSVVRYCSFFSSVQLVFLRRRCTEICFKVDLFC